MSPNTAHRASDQRRSLVLAVVSLTGASALIHAIVASEHLRDFWPAGFFFILAAAMQLALELTIWRRPTRPLLKLAAYGTAAVVLVWLTTRTIGLPIGPHAGQAEAVGPLDALATLNELLTIGLIGVLLAGRTISVALTRGTVSTVIIASLLASVVGPPHHSHREHPQERPHGDSHARSQ